MNITDFLAQSSIPFAIYGAQVVAYGAYKAILELTGNKPEYFLVSQLKNNPTAIEGISVQTPEMVNQDVCIIVAVTKLLHKEVGAALNSFDFKNIVFLNEQEEFYLMSCYYAKIGKFPIAKHVEFSPHVDLAVYEVRNHKDKELTTKPVLQAFEHTLQAGAALTEERIASLCDSTGVNISSRNKQYCEMTATYWVWKNTSHDWKGIEHYRRHLCVEEDMITDKIDAILPFPYICYPDAIHQLSRFVCKDVIDAMLYALNSLHAEQFEDYLDILHGPYQYTYNLVCAKSEVFDSYCSWFFEITEFMEKHSGLSMIQDTRALSYVAEALTNIFFMRNQNKYRIVHTKKTIFT